MILYNQSTSKTVMRTTTSSRKQLKMGLPSSSPYTWMTCYSLSCMLESSPSLFGNSGCVDCCWKSTTKLCRLCGASSWKSKLQECTNTSTTYTEYIAASDAAKESLWLDRPVCTFRQADSIFVPVVYSDSQGAIALSKTRSATTPPNILTFGITLFGTV